MVTKIGKDGNSVYYITVTSDFFKEGMKISEFQNKIENSSYRYSEIFYKSQSAPLDNASDVDLLKQWKHHWDHLVFNQLAL